MDPSISGPRSMLCVRRGRKRLEYAFIVFASARLAIVERSTEHISATSEWMNISQTERCHFFSKKIQYRRRHLPEIPQSS